MEKIIDKYYNKLYILKVNPDSDILKYPIISEFKKDMINIFFINHINKEFFGLIHLNKTIICFFKHLFNIDEKYLTNFLYDIDCHTIKMAEYVINITMITNSVFNYKIIQECFITMISRILLNQILCNSCLKKVDEPKSLHAFTSKFNKSFSKEKKIILIETLWEIILEDNEIHEYESNLIRRLAGLLYISDVDCGNAKKRILNKLIKK